MAHTIIPTEDTVQQDADVETAEKPTSEPEPSSNRQPGRRRAVMSWLAVGAAVGVAVGFALSVIVTGGNEAGSLPADVHGSDVHLYNLADDIANRSADATGSVVADLPADVHGSDVHLYNLADDVANRAG